MATTKIDPRSRAEHETPHAFLLPTTDDIEAAIAGEDSEDDEDDE